MQIGVFTNTQFIRVFHWALEITNHQRVFIIKGSPKMWNRKVCVPLIPNTHCLQLENVCCRWLVDLGKTYIVFHTTPKAKIKLSGSICSPGLSLSKEILISTRFWLKGIPWKNHRPSITRLLKWADSRGNCEQNESHRCHWVGSQTLLISVSGIAVQFLEHEPC